MTERLSDKNPCKLLKEGCRWRGNCDKRQLWSNKCIEKLKEYETAEEEGRLVVLPCKVGDFVYKIIYQRDNFDDRPYRIVTAVKFTLDMADDIGKTVFLTREEAEKELKRMGRER